MVTALGGGYIAFWRYFNRDWVTGFEFFSIFKRTLWVAIEGDYDLYSEWLSLKQLLLYSYPNTFICMLLCRVYFDNDRCAELKNRNLFKSVFPLQFN